MMKFFLFNIPVFNFAAPELKLNVVTLYTPFDLYQTHDRYHNTSNVKYMSLYDPQHSQK